MRGDVRFATVVLAAGLALAVAGCGSSNSSSSQSSSSGTANSGHFSAGLVTDVGGLNDKSFNHDAYLGLQAAHTRYGVATSVTESHAETDYVPNLTNYAKSRTGITVAVGFLMESAIYSVANPYSKASFAIIDGAGTVALGVTVAVGGLSAGAAGPAATRAFNSSMSCCACVNCCTRRSIR